MSEAAQTSFWERYFCSTSPRDRRNQTRYILLLAAWAVVFLASTFVIATERVAGFVGWSVATVPSVIAVFAVLAYWRYLREADELARAIEIQALALAVGAGFIAWPAYRLFGELGLAVNKLPSIPVLIMIAAYVIGTGLGWRRYR